MPRQRELDHLQKPQPSVVNHALYAEESSRTLARFLMCYSTGAWYLMVLLAPFIGSHALAFRGSLRRHRLRELFHYCCCDFSLPPPPTANRACAVEVEFARARTHAQGMGDEADLLLKDEN